MTYTQRIYDVYSRHTGQGAGAGAGRDCVFGSARQGRAPAARATCGRLPRQPSRQRPHHRLRSPLALGRCVCVSMEMMSMTMNMSMDEYENEYE